MVNIDAIITNLDQLEEKIRDGHYDDEFISHLSYLIAENEAVDDSALCFEFTVNNVRSNRNIVLTPGIDSKDFTEDEVRINNLLAAKIRKIYADLGGKITNSKLESREVKTKTYTMTFNQWEYTHMKNLLEHHLATIDNAPGYMHCREDYYTNLINAIESFDYAKVEETITIEEYDPDNDIPF